MLTAALVAAALAAGIAGTWSPCGLSAIDTIGRASSGRWSKAAALTTFSLGAVTGAIALFAALSGVGSLLPIDPSNAVLVGIATVAALAAVADASGLRVAPQVRRQVPEPWRRALPLPLAVGLYGALLGLGFTTFVLTFALWALAAVTLVLGDVAVGLAVGAGFGLGRALPVALAAPFAHRFGEVFAKRPALLRVARTAAAAGLAVASVALVSENAAAATRVAADARDPTVAGDLVAWETSSRIVLVRPEGQVFVLGRDPALGGSLFAWRSGNAVTIMRAADLGRVATLELAGVDALAISDTWLVYRRRTAEGSDELVAHQLATGDARVIASARPPAQLGRPALDGETVVFHHATARTSSIVEVDLAQSATRVLRRSAVEELTNPSIAGDALLYVRRTSRRQRLVLTTRAAGARERVLLRAAGTSFRDSGFQRGYSTHTRTPRAGRRAKASFWTTALSAGYAYVTLDPVGRGRPTLIRVPRGA